MPHTLRNLLPFISKARPAKAQISSTVHRRAAHLANQFIALDLRAPTLAVLLEQTAADLMARAELPAVSSRAHYALLWAAPFLIGV